MRRVGKPLKDWDINIYRGIVTGCNEAFIIDDAKREQLIEQDPMSAEIIKPLLRGKDIKRYYARPSGILNSCNWLFDSMALFHYMRYPSNIYEHLETMAEQIDSKKIILPSTIIYCNR